MNVRRFIGKKVSLEKLEECATYLYPPEETGEEYTIAEIFINFDWSDSIPEECHFDSFSITLLLDDDKIIKITRSGYEYYCNCDYSSTELHRFPGKALEKKAEKILISLLK